MKYKVKQGDIYHSWPDWHELKWLIIPIIEKDEEKKIPYGRNCFCLIVI